MHAVEENEAGPEVAALYLEFRAQFGRPSIPGVLKCFATHPPLLQHMMAISESLLFCDGRLTRRHKEMIATFVSSLNSCAYCADSHGYFLRMQGGSAEALLAIKQCDLTSSSLTTAEKALLAFVQKVTQDSVAVKRTDIDQLICTGWTEPQLAEATHIIALFAAFNRVANTFGLPSQQLLDLLETSPSTDAARSTADPRSTS